MSGENTWHGLSNFYFTQRLIAKTFWMSGENTWHGLKGSQIGLFESNARLSVRGSNAQKVIDSPERSYRLQNNCGEAIVPECKLLPGQGYVCGSPSGGLDFFDSFCGNGKKNNNFYFTQRPQRLIAKTFWMSGENTWHGLNNIVEFFVPSSLC